MLTPKKGWFKSNIPHKLLRMFLLQEYSKILIFMLIALVLAMVLFLLSYSLVLKKPELEKVSAYECGFDPFSDARSKFDVRFYLVAILFIIFDLEITFLFPWAVALNSVGFVGIFTMLYFLVILTVGFVYEWKKGALGLGMMVQNIVVLLKNFLKIYISNICLKQNIIYICLNNGSFLANFLYIIKNSSFLQFTQLLDILDRRFANI